MAKLTSSPHQLSEILPWLVSLSVLTIRPHVRDSRLTTCGPDQREKKPKIFRPIFFCVIVFDQEERDVAAERRNRNH